jgi:hypothetical protein
MPIHLLPIAIVVAKVGASAVVSLSPAAMTIEQDQHGEAVTPTPRLRDFFKKDFYKREFARLENEEVGSRRNT